MRPRHPAAAGGALVLACACAVTHEGTGGGAGGSAGVSEGLLFASELQGAQGAGAEPAGASKEDLAKQLSNPVASLISVPLQLNYDQDIGPSDKGSRLLLNVQPVIPMSLNETWNVISRTIVPIVSQEDIPPGNDESGLGDVVQSLFFSPVQPTEGGLIWGVGPVFLLPTATDETLGAEQWGIGPTVVMLEQAGPWTYGLLANHVWSVAGSDSRPDVNSTLTQPFLSFTTPAAWTYTANLESTYDWEESDLAVPLNVGTSKVLSLSGQLVSAQAGLRYWMESPDSAPAGFGLRVSLTFLYPRGG